LSQIQAKETTNITEETYNLIRGELKKQRFFNLKKLSFLYMKSVLKRLNLTNLYEHTSFIISKLSGLPPPTISRDAEEKIKAMFRQVQGPYAKHCPKSRINFFSYAFFLHKACQLLELDELTQYFALLKSDTKLRLQDTIWKLVCRDLRWEFHQSI